MVRCVHLTRYTCVYIYIYANAPPDTDFPHTYETYNHDVMNVLIHTIMFMISMSLIENMVITNAIIIITFHSLKIMIIM